MKKYLLLIILCFLGCTNSDDGPISIYPDELSGDYSGFVLKASLDSSKAVHLKSDTLEVLLDSIWTLSNCFLDQLIIEERYEDTILYLEPKVEFSLTSEDCASPLFFPETTLYIPPSSSWESLRSIIVYNSKGEVEDSISLRNGSFLRDTLKIYLDSSFSDPYALPRKTKDYPSVLKTIDSLKERTFYYRFMPSNCTYIIDSCQTQQDTIYPSNWSLRDTNLVPIRKVCKDSTLRYCLQRDWENDSLSLGELKERLDTLWFSSWYLVEKIPEGGMVNQMQHTSPVENRHFQLELEIFKPASEKDYMNTLGTDLWVSSLDSVKFIPLSDSLKEIFDKASISRDTL